ncbi:MAG: 3-hydroxyacyl-ACP dehydratase [Chitinophagaceae bacterium]
MMLLNNFFTINNVTTVAFEVKAELVIDATHKIFEGHFPGQPVVPGVCMMQIVKEVLEQVTGQNTNLSNAQEMKFLAVINPQIHNTIQLSLKYSVGENSAFNVSAMLFTEGFTHFKFKGVFGIDRVFVIEK